MNQAAPAILAVKGLTKTYAGQAVVSDVTLEIQEGEFLTLLGPSGCGKTTTIRIIGGYATPSSGQVLLDGKEITNLPPQQRNMAMVFQNYALFPHMTVAQNIAFPLEIRRMGRKEIDRRITEMLDLVRLPNLKDRLPTQLSGGQQQRVALARALAYSPRILLMDEALGALDVKLREEMQFEIKRIQRELKITTIHVTHDQEEALSMSDRILVMREGRVAQLDTPKALYERPNSAYVADFIGKINLFTAVVKSAGPDGCVLVLTGVGDDTDGTQVTARGDRSVQPGQKVKVGIRPEYVQVRRESTPQNCVKAMLESAKFVGAHQFLGLRTASAQLVLSLDQQKGDLGSGQVYACWAPEHTLVFPDGEV